MVSASRAIAAWPFQKIRSPRCRFVRFRGQRPAKAVLLHVAVARAAIPRHSAELHEARAIDAEASLAAPEIGRADEAFGNRDEIGSRVVEPARCGFGRYQPSRVTAKVSSSRNTVTIAPIEQRLDRRQFDRGPGKAKVLIAVTLWVGSAAGFPSAKSGSQPT